MGVKEGNLLQEQSGEEDDSLKGLVLGKATFCLTV
jgi:hypothetical protein